MESVYRLLGLAVGMAVIALTLRTGSKSYAAVFSLLAGAALLLMLMQPLGEAVRVFADITAKAQVQSGQVALVFKLLGVAFAAEFAAQACRDAGEEGLAMRVELGAKVALLGISAPLFEQLCAMIANLTV